MLRLEGNRDVHFCDGLTRRDFLRAGGLAMGLGLTQLAGLQQAGAAPSADEMGCIQLFLVGGPSHLDTWDLKPDAPEEVRGPFRPIATNVPGIRIGEHFPLMSRMADRFAVVRSIYHQEAPIHETGHQLMQTGHLFRSGVEYPHYGAVMSKIRGGVAVPPWVILPTPIENTGVSVSHGQGAGFLGNEFEPFVLQSRERHGLDPARLPSRTALLDAVDDAQCAFEAGPQPGDAALREATRQLFHPNAKKAFDLEAESATTRARYGHHTFGQSCLLARRLIEHGVKLVTVNMFDTVFNAVTWDCHANGGDLNTTLDDYRTTLCPMLDQAYSALLQDLHDRGLLRRTLVLCMGEFGRTPKINNRGGRDHWPGCWSALLAGGPIQGGRVVGRSDSLGTEPAERPVHPSEIAATVYHGLGIDPSARIEGPDGRPVQLVEATPIAELF